MITPCPGLCIDVAEVFQIFVTEPLKIATGGRHVRISVSDLDQAARILS
jgi:hypothetical protein